MPASIHKRPSATIRRLETKPERLNAERVDAVLTALDQLPLPLPAPVMAQVKAVLAKNTPSSRRWSFIMVSPEHNAEIVTWLVEHSSRPLVACKLWSLLLANLDFDSGQVLLTRDQLAEKVGESADNVSRIISELVSLGAVSRQREKIAGMRGPGAAFYYVNPTVATRLPGALRDAAQDAAPPLLSLMHGGKTG